MQARPTAQHGEFIMVAPNGGRRTRANHEAIPLTVAELVSTARACWAEGAVALHAHVRNADGEHVLDAGQYRELIAGMREVLPQMQVQVTTESLGRYSAGEQRKLVRELGHGHFSLALREQDPESDPPTARCFYHWAGEAGIELQHILYSPEERMRLERLQDDGIIPDAPQRVLFVSGLNRNGLQSHPGSLERFLAAGNRTLRWMACAFGRAETGCLVHARRLGGELRVGFENNDINRDGSRAGSNAERVRDLVLALADGQFPEADPP